MFNWQILLNPFGTIIMNLLYLNLLFISSKKIATFPPQPIQTWVLYVSVIPVLYVSAIPTWKHTIFISCKWEFRNYSPELLDKIGMITFSNCSIPYFTYMYLNTLSWCHYNWNVRLLYTDLDMYSWICRPFWGARSHSRL